MEYEIPLILIAQPGKLAPSAVLTFGDPKDSVEVFSDADQILPPQCQLIGAANVGEGVSAVAGAADNM